MSLPAKEITLFNKWDKWAVIGALTMALVDWCNIGLQGQVINSPSVRGVQYFRMTQSRPSSMMSTFNRYSSGVNNQPYTNRSMTNPHALSFSARGGAPLTTSSRGRSSARLRSTRIGKSGISPGTGNFRSNRQRLRSLTGISPQQTAASPTQVTPVFRIFQNRNAFTVRTSDLGKTSLRLGTTASTGSLTRSRSNPLENTRLNTLGITRNWADLKTDFDNSPTKPNTFLIAPLKLRGARANLANVSQVKTGLDRTRLAGNKLNRINRLNKNPLNSLQKNPGTLTTNQSTTR